MDLQSIIKEVRWCIDEESGYTDMDNTYMDNIIKAKIGDALRFICLYGNASLLTGAESGSTDVGIVKDYNIDGTETTAPKIVSQSTDTVCSIELPSDTLKVVRVKATGWHRAIMTPIAEDSEEYLMLSDSCATATKDRPQVALIATNPMRLEVYPKPSTSDSIQVTIVKDVSQSSSSGSGSSISYNIPPKAKTAFIYYIAYLVMSAYNDQGKASLMLSIAKQHLGIA